MRTFAALLLLLPTALAASIERVQPACAAPGDYVLICGAEFGDDPVVTFNGTAADVVRSRDDKILTRVPEGVAPGEVTIDVGDASAAFTALPAGAPVVLHLSASKATPGMTLVLIGARLDGGSVEFVDESDAVAGADELAGGRRIAFFKVPNDLAVGTYTLRVMNADGVDSGACSPTLEVVEAGIATIDSIEPADRLPGQGVRIDGTDLGPFGFAFVDWTDGDGETISTLGFANGFDRVWTRVPFSAQAGVTYDVVVEFMDGTTTQGAVSYEVGTPPPPEIAMLGHDTGPACDLLKIEGSGLFTGYQIPTVEFTRDGVATEALVLGGYRKHSTDVIEVQVPDVADGAYDVTVTNGADLTSNAATFTVAATELAVTSMEPDHQGPLGPHYPVVIEGSGFGAHCVSHNSPLGNGTPGLGLERDGPADLAVTWDDGSGAEPREGFILYNTDRTILVIPPGGWFQPLPEGEYTVRVVVHPDSDEPEVANAGTYTVR